MNDDSEEMTLLLFYIVHSFESMVNNHINNELKHQHHFTHQEIKRVIFSLSMEAKLGWFLKLICGKDYTKNKNWPLIYNYTKTRNFYIHYKPKVTDICSTHEEKLSKKSIRSF